MLLLVLSNIMGMLGFYVPFVYIFELAKARGCSESDATLLLSLIGITNTFGSYDLLVPFYIRTLGRIFFGWAADRRWVTALAINNFSLIFCGILTAICPFFTNFATLTVYSCLFGFIVCKLEFFFAMTPTFSRLHLPYFDCAQWLTWSGTLDELLRTFSCRSWYRCLVGNSVSW